MKETVKTEYEYCHVATSLFVSYYGGSDLDS
jgi:hypothetical protein